jgi:branched-chain amino acid transport system permease protein
MELVLIQILNGLQYGLLIFLAASGLTLVFGILGVINLSHGSFYMLGAYLSLTLTSLTGDIFLALALGIPIAFRSSGCSSATSMPAIICSRCCSPLASS